MLTSPSNIFSRDPGSNYDLTVDDAAMATSIQNALNTQAQYGAGTSAERTAALGQFMNGAIWYDTTTSSEWRKISGAWVNQDTGWVALSPASGVTPSSSDTGPGQVRRIGNTVFVRGSFDKTTGVWANGDTFATMPEGFRPEVSFMCPGTGTAGSVFRMRVQSDGALRFFSAPNGPTNNVYLGGLSWVTA